MDHTFIYDGGGDLIFQVFIFFLLTKASTYNSISFFRKKNVRFENMITSPAE